MARSNPIRYAILFFPGLGAALVAWSVISATPQSAPALGRADIVPVLRVKTGGKQHIEIDFENTSDTTFRYLLSNTDGVYPLEILLYRDGVFIEPREEEEPPLEVPSRVGELKPGQRVRHAISLADEYGRLKPGKYELKARFIRYQPGELHLTPMQFERKLANIDIEP